MLNITPNHPPDTPPRQTTEIVRTDYSTALQIAKIATLWGRQAKQYHAESPDHPPSLKGCATICQSIRQQIHYALWDGSDFPTTYIYKSPDGNIQGIATTQSRQCPLDQKQQHFWRNREEECSFVSFLVSNPDNLRCKAEGRSDCISDIGSSLLKHIEAQARREGKRGLFLSPLSGSEKFYSSQGLKADHQDPDFFSKYWKS